MVYEIENPFVGYASMVKGERFIGRKNLITVIENRIVHSKNPGNLAIIGVHRIGKSSLAYKTVIEQKDNLVKKGVLPIWMGLDYYQQPSRFFDELVETCIREMRKLGWLTNEIESSAEDVIETLKAKNEVPWRKITYFFEDIKEAGYSTLFVLDEFDRARTLFSGDTAFQGLRALADYPDCGFALVLTARRSIMEIERQAGSSSPFHNIFQVHRLGMFNDEDMEAYFSQFEPIGSLSENAQERVLFYCGAHPYLLAMLGCEISEQFNRNGKIDVDEAAATLQHAIFEHYDDMIRLLREEGYLNKLLQILFGPPIDVRPTDVTELENYGLIKPKAGIYVAYSEHFHDYLEMQERTLEFANDLWPIWRQTEKALRIVITKTLFEAYGAEWIEELEKARPNLRKIFNNCRTAQQKEEEKFGARASQQLIDFTYPANLFEIIRAKGLWKDYFEPIFGRNPNYWEERSQLLAKCRTPLAHNRAEILQPYEWRTIEGYCHEILTLLAEYTE